MTPTSIVAYLALFAAVAFLFVLASLLLGRLVRAQDPSPGKREIYECGEPPIGPGFVQFDLRFYVVALLFIIFDVEVAFFFPWATVFGKATALMNPSVQAVAPAADGGLVLDAVVRQKLQELGVAEPTVPAATGVAAASGAVRQSARRLALAAMVDIGVFFGVLMLGFAYLWKKGDLDWVRVPAGPAARRPEGEQPRKLVLVGSQAMAETSP